MNRYKIVIVGVGPKGLYAFERLLARLQQTNDDLKIEIHLFEKTGYFGSGGIYRPDQPEYLLMNYPNRNINVWPKEKPEPLVPESLNFVAWLRENGCTSFNTSENGFAPRRMVGEYLIDCFNLLEKYKKDSIKLIKHVAEVTDVATYDDGLILKYADESGEFLTTLKVHEVLLTTGHSSCTGSLERDQDNGTSDIIDRTFINFVYPVQEKLALIEKKTTVGVKGLGLTFIDTVLALTEGRGGRFENLNDENLMYLPSGQEPKKIFPFSRSGLPMIPRSAHEGVKPYTPVYFTYENIKSQVDFNQKLSFVEHLLPLLIAEMKFRYYRILFRNHGLNFYPCKNLGSFYKLIEAFHNQNPHIYRFDFKDLVKAKPFDKATPELGAHAYWRYLLKEADIGSESSPFMAAAMTWGMVSPIFNAIYSFGGMTADSHAIFDTQYRTVLNRISYGPPLKNMKKMMALIEIGLVNLDFVENPTVQKQERGWRMDIRQLKFQKFDVLIDARIPSLKSTKDWSSLFANMRENEILRAFKIYGDTSYEPGCPEIDRQGRAIDYNGRSIGNISLYGTPTEGITYDNDTLSRTRNNFASQWALNVLENCKGTTLKSKHLKFQNG